MKQIMVILTALMLTSAAYGGRAKGSQKAVCDKAVGYEIVASGVSVKSEAGALLDVLGIDPDPRVVAFARDLKEGKGCLPNSCIKVLTTFRESVTGPIVNIVQLCVEESK